MFVKLLLNLTSSAVTVFLSNSSEGKTIKKPKKNPTKPPPKHQTSSSPAFLSLNSGDATSEILYPHLGSPVQKRNRGTGESLMKVHKDDGLKHLLDEERLRTGIVQSEGEKAQGGLTNM